MTKGWKPGDPVPNVHDGVARMLAEAGYPDEAVPALLAFDVAQFQWYRMTVKGDMLRVILRRIGAGIEQAQFQALTAILRVEGGVGRAPAAATVGLVAEQMNVDPSRAAGCCPNWWHGAWSSAARRKRMAGGWCWS